MPRLPTSLRRKTRPSRHYAPTPRSAREANPAARAHRGARWLAIALAGLLLGACGILDTPAQRGVGLPEHTMHALQPQMPRLPAASPRALPQPEWPEPYIRPMDFSPMAITTDRVALEVLVISATTDDPALGAWMALLDQAGIPHDVLIARDEDLTTSRLVEDGVGRYQAILLATNNLAYQEGDTFVSAFTLEEWELLFQYEREFGARQVSFYTFPGLEPESFGITLAQGEAGEAAPPGYTIHATAAGRKVFSNLADDAEIPVRDTWVYPSELVAGSEAVPLLEDDAGNVLAVLSESSDGRERLALTFDQAAYLTHSQLLGHGLVRWATRGVYLGQRRHHLDADVDDWFLPTDLWDVEAGDFSDEEFHLSANDAFSASQQQQALRDAFPVASDFAWAMAFNGMGADPQAPLDCDPANTADGALSSMTKCVADEFRWVNHSWSHAYMDRNPPHYDIGYAAIHAEISQNQAIVDDLGMTSTYAPGSLVTGDISGLGWHAPEGPDTGPKVDFGLDASNPDLLAAFADLGGTYLASNMSTASHEPECAGCGMWHPLDARVLLVPRWPTNVFAPVTTPEAAIQAYNGIYGPGGSDPFFDHDLSYDEYLDVESDIAMFHVLSGSPYPHYFHVANLYEYEPGRSLLYDWTERLLEKYTSYFDLPLRSLEWDDLGAHVARRTSHAHSNVRGVWDRVEDTLTITAGNGGTIFLTGASLGGAAHDVTYGDDLISRRDFAVGETLTVAAPDADPPAPPETTTLSIATEGNGTTTGSGTYLVYETATLEATPAEAWRFDRWSGDLTGTNNPASLAMGEDRNVTAHFVEMLAQSIDFPPLVDRFSDSAPFQVQASASSGLPVAFSSSGACSVSGDTVTLTGAEGTCTITASQAGNDAYLPADGVARSFDVNEPPPEPQPQTITFPALPDRFAHEPPFEVQATASSGLPVDLVSSGVCSADGTTVSLTGETGTCTVTASQAGSSNYLPADDVVRSFDVLPVPVHELTVRVRGDGFGAVAASPGGVSCTGTCTSGFDHGTVVTLVAVPVYGSSFAGWSGACGGTGGCTLEVEADAAVTATFVPSD